MDSNYLMYLASSNLSSIEYKIILILLIKPRTATQVVSELGIIKENKGRYFKKLKSMGIIEISYTEGRNKYYRVVTNMKKLTEIMPGQMKM